MENSPSAAIQFPQVVVGVGVRPAHRPSGHVAPAVGVIFMLIETSNPGW
jgi:hypothetical protein